MLMTILSFGAVALFILLGVVGYLLIIASSRTEHTEAQVQALLHQACAGRQQ